MVTGSQRPPWSSEIPKDDRQDEAGDQYIEIVLFQEVADDRKAYPGDRREDEQQQPERDKGPAFAMTDGLQHLQRLSHFVGFAPEGIESRLLIPVADEVDDPPCRYDQGGKQ